MKAILIGLYSVINLASVDTFASTLSARDAKLKAEYLSKIACHGPASDDSYHQDIIWKNLIRIAAEYNDEETINKFFDFKSDGACGTQYTLDMFELFKKNSSFFLISADHHYKGDLDPVVKLFWNDAGDISKSDLERVLGKEKRNDKAFSLAQKFQSIAFPDKK